MIFHHQKHFFFRALLIFCSAMALPFFSGTCTDIEGRVLLTVRGDGVKANKADDALITRHLFEKLAAKETATGVVRVPLKVLIDQYTQSPYGGGVVQVFFVEGPGLEVGTLSVQEKPAEKYIELTPAKLINSSKIMLEWDLNQRILTLKAEGQYRIPRVYRIELPSHKAAKDSETPTT